MKNSVYAKAAVLALVKWNHKTLEEAQEIVATHTREEIEPMCYAEGSVRSGFDALVNAVRKKGVIITEEEEKKLYEIVLDGPEDSEELRKLGDKAASLDRKELTLDALTEIHDNWVRKSVAKFDRADREESLYMHMPIESIGWEDVELDYIFLKPLMESAGLSEDDKKLQEAYLQRCQEFWIEKHRLALTSLMMYLEDPVEFYPALKDYPIEKLQDFSVQSRIYDQIIDHMGYFRVARMYSEKTFKEGIENLSKIDKESMDERDFYEEVLKQIVSMGHVSFSDEKALKLKETLQKIGCVDYQTWKEEQLRKGIVTKNVCLGDGMEKAEISTAVDIISQFLLEPEDTRNMMFYVGTNQTEGVATIWLRNSSKIPRNSSKESTLLKKVQELRRLEIENKELENACEKIIPEVSENPNKSKEGTEE